MYQSVTLGAGVAVEFSDSADFFRMLKSPTDDVTVIFYRNGQELSRAENVGIGYAERFNNVAFDRVRISSAGGGVVRFVSRLGSDVRYDTPPTGSVAVANTGGTISRVAASVTSSAATTLSAANASRRYLLIQNNDSANYLRLRVDGTAATVSTGIRIPPGGYFESSPLFAPTGAISLIAESGTIAVEAMEG